MSQKVPAGIWAEFSAMADDERAAAFGQLKGDAILHVGDGGTFVCQIDQPVKPGSWRMWRMKTDDIDAVLAVQKNAKPTSWASAGSISLDSGVAAILPDAALIEIQALEDTEVLTDKIDEAIFAADVSHGIVKTPGGSALAVFRTLGDGEYAVYRGSSRSSDVCVLIVIIGRRLTTL